MKPNLSPTPKAHDAPVPAIVPVDVRKVWDDFKPRLQELCESYDTGWRPEDVYHLALLERVAVYHDPGSPGNYAVMRLRDDYGVTVLFIWIVIGQGDVIGRYQDELARIAREAGARRIVFESPRKGFFRLEGWKPYMTIFHRDTEA